MITTLLLCCGPLSSLLAKPYYIDNAAPAGGDGSSWALAWNAFAKIDWNRIQPGDTLYISGGTEAKVYNENLTVHASGTAPAPVRITTGPTAGHNGRVILDGQMQIDHGVLIESRGYVTVSGLQVRNFFGPGQVRVRYSTGVIVERNELHVTGHGGVFLWSNINTIVRENRITTPESMTAQTDGLYSQHNTNNLYESNIIIISNEAADEHNDGIQLFRDTGTTIRNNYIEQDTHKTFNAQGIFIEDSWGTIDVYNNIIYGPNTNNALLTLWNRSDGTAQLLAHQNTVLGGGWGVVYVGNSPQSQVKNNILASEKEGAAILRLSGALPSPDNIDANLYYLPHSSAYGWIEEEGQYSWSAWRERGMERHGAIGDPGFTSISARDFSLTDNSPAVDAGIPLGLRYQQDMLGTVRPQSQAWDMGALEYTMLPTLPAPNPPEPDSSPPELDPSTLKAVLENPYPLSHQSGIGLISGWVCEATQVEIELGETVVLQAGYGTNREDTEARCGDAANGFGLLFNWNLLGDGTHTVRALADGEEFALAEVTVTTLAQEFLTGAFGEFTLPGFPSAEETTVVYWQPSAQNFIIRSLDEVVGGDPGSSSAVLENPQPGSFQSGIGLISGWVCEATQIEIEVGGTALQASYGTSRVDTQEMCGDTNNGFGLLFNWNLLGDGSHTVRALADGEEFAWALVVVTTLGEEFRIGLDGTFTLADFPEAGQDVALLWQESLQNFVITAASQETLMLDSRTSVAGDLPLTAEKSYLLTADGTYSLWQTWDAACAGSPEEAPRYPSPDVPIGPVGVDAAYIFAAPTGAFVCDAGAFPQVYQGLELSLDGGATWRRPAPLNPAFSPTHTYQYQVVGEGQPLQLRLFDSDTSDNYGQLRIQVQQMPTQSATPLSMS